VAGNWCADSEGERGSVMMAFNILGAIFLILIFAAVMTGAGEQRR
jgi:hypothetical protein